VELPVEQTPEPPINIVPPKPQPNYLSWMMIGIGLTIIFLLIVVAVIGAGIISTTLQNKNNQVSVAPPETTQPTTPQATPSAFATDSGLLKIRADLLDLRSQIDAIDYFEPQIAPPTIDLNINIPQAR
jgi:hypothetical protein